MDRTIILASASPRRRELMQMLGIHNLIVRPAKGEEHLPEKAGPEEIVCMLSAAKAREVWEQSPDDSLVLAADTIVWLDGLALGKPRNEVEAAVMLRSLSGRCHEVYTGVTLMDSSGCQSRAERSVVCFRELSDDEICRYVQSGEPMDKAGAYGAQGKGALFVRRIEGDFFNVMGLPLCLLGQMLAAKGVQIL